MSGVVEEMWLAYSKVLPADVGAVQYNETRRAFYAGALALFHNIVASLDEDEEPTEADVAKLNAIEMELDAWTRAEILSGKAVRS